MMQTSVFRKLFLLLPLAYHQPAPYQPAYDEEIGLQEVQHWNYEQNGADWDDLCASGIRQSPLQLGLDMAHILHLPRLQFHNYAVRLRGPLTLVNNGHSVHVDIPETENGEKPYIMGGALFSRFEAEGFHFHWGSPTSRGSEHVINRQRFDVELHIVHRNVRYANLDEAVRHSDGLAVLAILFKIVRNPLRMYPGLAKVFANMSNIKEYDTVTDIPGTLALGQLLGDVSTREFYAYKGSLTTPGCAEAVNWIVFPQVLPIPQAYVAKLWQLEDPEGEPLRNTYRLTHPRNDRKIYYRASMDFSNFIFFK